jgi:carbamoyl-phosphate synthase large subunit
MAWLKRIVLSEAGGTLTRNVVASLRAAPERIHIVGISSNPYELAVSGCDEAFLVPRASDLQFIPTIAEVVHRTGATFLHSQHDAVIKVLSKYRHELAVRMFLPTEQTVSSCIDKYQSYRLWAQAGITVPKTREICSPADLEDAFTSLGPSIWLRLKEGGGGSGSLPADDFAFAKAWIEHFNGWGNFTAAEILSPDSVTWTSIWQRGQLLVAQGRKRLGWLFGSRTLSGVTGVTGVGQTVSDPTVDAVAQRAIFAIDPSPDGIFSVDMTYNRDGEPCPTEINIGRFFTTIHFFTQAGVNFPYIFLKAAYGEEPPLPDRRQNPLEPGLLWIRGMDMLPVLSSHDGIAVYRKTLDSLLKASCAGPDSR